ncbi:hypothetical protein IFT79_07125 [Frigoribacterium sp. CFBP 8759]|uniref:hypothetical protein n=1 Tax=Frigoribacterium sp. CFBP 8759 TaxID=2775283 RepID=UPI0017807EFD|nr:hypothetical protein [Frigoribacterium sp. CFBP 8759]MBD8485384.1 hypothetical protein [Frigoribacterium sp. CFBP 8759]
MQDIREAIDRLTAAVESQGSPFELWSGIIIPLAVSALSSGLVIFVLVFQHRVRKRELSAEAAIRADERREAVLVARAAAKRRAASTFISALNTAYTQNAFRRNKTQVEDARTRVAIAIENVQAAATLELDDEDMPIRYYVNNRLGAAFTAGDSAASSKIARAATENVRRWLRDEITVAELPTERDLSIPEN